MEILKIIVLLLSAVILLSSCVPTGEGALDYQDSPFSDVISIELDGLSATAELSAYPTENDKSIYLKFTAPDSLAGIEIKYRDGSATARLGELIFHEASYLNIADLFSIDGRINKISQEKLGAVNCNCLDIISSKGESYKVYLSQDGKPRRIVRLGNDPLTVNIIAFGSTD